jgi:hypothetical protein
MKSYHSFLYNELCLKSLKKLLLLNPKYKSSSNRDYLLTTECIYVGVTGSTPQKFLAHNNNAHVVTRISKLCGLVNGFNLLLVFIGSY